MIPHETGADMIERAFSMLREGLEARIRESIAAARIERPSGAEIVSAAEMARASGYSCAAVSRWCARGEIAGAIQHGPRGHWRFSRAAWDAFLSGSRRRPRRRFTIAA